MSENEFTEFQNKLLDGLLFEVVDPSNNKHYKIYGDGRLEGFGDAKPLYVSYHFYAVARTLLMAQRRSLLAEPSPISSLVESGDGLSHGEAL